MRTINKGDAIITEKIPNLIGCEQPFENASDFYLLKDNDDGLSVVIGRVRMCSRYHTLSIDCDRDETDSNLLQYFYNMKVNDRNFRFGPKFDIYGLRFVDGAFAEDENHKWHNDFTKLRLVPKMWAEFFYRD